MSFSNNLVVNGRSQPRVLLEDYYKRTAHQYDHMHHLAEEHYTALRIIAGFISSLRVQSVLDLGTGTGRGVQFLSGLLPHLKMFGADLSQDLLREGIRKRSLRTRSVCVADARKLPFQDNVFDFSIETAVLHHVPDPLAVVSEMLRVSRIGIAISDSNMYVDGTSRGFLPKGIIGSTVKMLLCKTGIWKSLKLLLTGKEWSYSEGDGIFWTYSVYDSLAYAKTHCSQVITVPLKGGRLKDTIPLLDASHVLVIGVKRPAAASLSSKSL
jgi:ubiquinone/menaquinone biosynthesis C-methylase UbiE